MFAKTTRRTELTARLLLVVLLELTCAAVGCDSVLALYGLDPGGGNPNTLDTPTGAGTVRLTPVTFSPTSGFPQGADPATFNVDGGTITTSGGTAGIVAAAVNAGGSFDQVGGFFDTVSAPEGATIDSLSFEFDDSADAPDVATLDVLELTVRE